MTEQFTGLTIGIVRDNDDPQQMGRLKVYVPSLDSRYYKTEDLPWALYVTPFGGSVTDMTVGRAGDSLPNISSYGMWAVPKNGAHVIVGCLDGDIQARFWIGCIYTAELNRTMPQALNDPGSKDLKTEIQKSGENDVEPLKDPLKSKKIPHYEKNLSEAGLGPKDPNFPTRGYERSVAYPLNRSKSKPSSDGYADKPSGGGKDSQIFSITSPGHHFITMSDVSDHCRMRFKTTEGHQIILDDTNERIYISTAKGRNWVEIDEDGRIMIFAKDEINIRSEDDINIKSEKNINMRAKKKINLHSEDEEINIQAKQHINIKSTDDKISLDSKEGFNVKVQDGPIKIDSEKDIDVTSNDGKITIFSKKEFGIRSDEDVKITAKEAIQLRSKVNKLTVDTSFFITAPANIIISNKILTGPTPHAEAAERAEKGEDVDDLNVKMVEPEHESWERPASKQQRNSKWKP